MSIYDHKAMEGKDSMEQATIAVIHTLRQISRRSDVKRLLGPGTETFDLLTECYSTITGEPLAEFRKSFLDQRQG